MHLSINLHVIFFNLVQILFKQKPLQFHQNNTKPTCKKNKVGCSWTWPAMNYLLVNPKWTDSPGKSWLLDSMQISSSCWCQLEILNLSTMLTSSNQNETKLLNNLYAKIFFFNARWYDVLHGFHVVPSVTPLLLHHGKEGEKKNMS